MAALAAALSGLSVGRQPTVWDDLPSLPAPLLVRPAWPMLPAILRERHFHATCCRPAQLQNSCHAHADICHPDFIRRHEGVLININSLPCKVLAGAQDTKFAEIGRQIVAAALGDQPPVGSASSEDTESAGGVNQELLAALPPASISSSSLAGVEATTVQSARSAAAVSDRLTDGNERRAERSNSNRARFTEVPGAGHAVHVERPEAVAQLLGAWLACDAS